MAATHPRNLRELVEWMREDAVVNRSRGGGTLSVVAVAIFRLNQFGVRGRGLAASVVRLLSLPLLAFSRLLLGCEVPGALACGRRFVLAHGGRGVIIVPNAVIGDDVVMGPYSGLGVAYPVPGAPTLGDRVYIGASVSVIGELTVGEGAFIGTRALVLKDVPPGKLAIGLPARAIGPAPAQP
ncbi:serine O-acetyltransferase [Geodermatophilus sp. SYSU D00079]